MSQLQSNGNETRMICMDIRCHFLCKGWSCHLSRLAFRCILLPHHSLPLNHLPLPFSLFFPLNFPFLPLDLPVPFPDRSDSLLEDLLLLVEGSRTTSRCSGIPGGMVKTVDLPLECPHDGPGVPRFQFLLCELSLLGLLLLDSWSPSLQLPAFLSFCLRIFYYHEINPPQ